MKTTHQSKAADEADLWNIFASFADQETQEDGGDSGVCGTVVGVAGECGGVASVAKFSCSTCKIGEVALEDGNYICKNCGDLVQRFIDSGAEWRYYGYDDSKGHDPTRCGLPLNELLPDSSLGSLIGYTKKETHELRIMRKYHMWNSMTYKERTLYNIFDTLTVNAVNNGINKSIIDEAKMLYKKISELKITRGENRNGLIASSIYMACKRNKVPRSAKEIAAIFNLKVTTMTKGCKRFQELLHMNMDATGPSDFIARFCSKMDLESSMRDICKHVVSRADDLSIMTENTPPSVAAAAIYMCNQLCGWGLPKATLSEICEISQVTISKCCSKLMKHKDMLLPSYVLKALDAAAVAAAANAEALAAAILDNPDGAIKEKKARSKGGASKKATAMLVAKNQHHLGDNMLKQITEELM